MSRKSRIRRRAEKPFGHWRARGTEGFRETCGATARAALLSVMQEYVWTKYDTPYLGKSDHTSYIHHIYITLTSYLQIPSPSIEVRHRIGSTE